MNSQRDKSLFHPSLHSGSQRAIRLFSTLRCRSGNRGVFRNFFKKNSKGFTLIELERSKSVRRNEGFTLIELLVVTVIITILTAAILVNYRNSEQQFALQRSAHKLAQDIRRAGEMAMSAKEITGPTGEKVIPSGGYGIYLRSLPNPPYYEIIIFADCNDNQQFTSGNVCGTPPNRFSESLEDVKLESGVKISNLSPNSPLQITFKPPSPKISIQGGDTAEITLALEADPTKTKKIKVNAVGLIEVE